MSRPTTTTDITAEPVEFASVDLGKIATDPGGPVPLSRGDCRHG